jgi:hypothetical protein
VENSKAVLLGNVITITRMVSPRGATAIHVSHLSTKKLAVTGRRALETFVGYVEYVASILSGGLMSPGGLK